jgi:hypothetical protein
MNEYSNVEEHEVNIEGCEVKDHFTPLTLTLEINILFYQLPLI